ncbi:MAG: AAA family ATPase [Rhodospirillales bacterium]|nr:AAA family ATPase [Rhodospirillales bacterium]
MNDSHFQDQIIEFLSQPHAFGNVALGVSGPVEKVETHISVIFLAGERAYKLKRALTLPYLDYSTLELRRLACEAEIAINRPLAPEIYRGVTPLTRLPGGGFRLGGPGEPVEYLVEMNRFGQDGLFDHLVGTGGLKPDGLEDLAQTIAAVHEQAEVSHERGGAAGTGEILANNGLSLIQAAEDCLDRAKVDALGRTSRDALEGLAPLLDARHGEGRVRHCHGDLHLGNLVLIKGQPVLFDAIEFSETFSLIDVFYDLAFLLMDLDHRGEGNGAARVLNRYLDVTGDAGALACLPLFLSMRASVRAYVAASRTAQNDYQREAKAYLDRAVSYLSPPPPRLIAIGGLSGTGKSSLAAGLAPGLGASPGAFIVRSDAIRKRLAGAGPHERLAPEFYGPDMGQRTYAQLMEDARTGLEAGHSVIADAVFARPDERAAIARVAGGLGLPFQGLWLDAPAHLLESRVTDRRNDVSDADAHIVRQQLDYDLGEMEWERMDSSGSFEQICQVAARILGLKTPQM